MNPMNSLVKTLLLLAFLSAGPLATAAPKLDTLFPAGGQRGTSVEVTASGTFDKWPAKIWASHPGIVAVPGKASGQARFTIAADVPCGLHWVRFSDKTGASGLRPFLVNQLPEIEEKEPNDDFKKPQTVPLPVIVNGRLAKTDDVDCFAVTLKKGQTLVAAVEANRTLRSPMDAVLQVLNADGFVLAQNDDYFGIDPLLAFEAPKAGVYVVRLFCFPAAPDATVRFFGKETCIYRLTLTTGPFVDRTWPLAVQRDRPGEVELIGWNIPAESRRVKVDASADRERVFLQPKAFANGVWVRTESHRTLTSAEELGTPPVSVSGHLPKPGSRAAFDLDGAKGKRLSIAVEARELDLPLDAVLTLRDGAGKTLQKVQSSKLNVDPAFEFVPPANGVYTLEVRDLHEDGGPRHAFLVRIRPALPGFDVTLATDRFETQAKAPLEIPIAVEYRHGMKGPIEFRAEGLPESARAEFVAGKDLKKSTVRIHGIDAAFSGPVRLFARAEGQPEQVVDADEWKVPFVWITVKEK
jgi:hypothetical protein